MANKRPGKTIPERLAEKIRKEIGIECEPSTFQRTYAGKTGRQQGPSYG